MTTTNEPAGIDLDNAALDNLEALARAATPGPWCDKKEYANRWRIDVEPAKYHPLAEVYSGIGDESCKQSAADSAFIAAANPETILALIAQARASQPEGATLASQEGITGTSQEETTGASESSQKLRGWLKGTVVTLPADFLHSVADELDDLRAQLAATTENLQTAVRQAWEANAELSKLRAAPASAQPDRGAAHAQQEAAPAEVTKSQERDYNWLLGLAKSKGYHTVYGALYAAPTAVPYLGILPSHSEREAANAGYQTNVLESCANWLDSRSHTVWANETGCCGLMRGYAADLRAVRADMLATSSTDRTTALEEAASFCETTELLFDPAEMLNSTKQQMTAITARMLADKIRKLADQYPATIAAGQEAANAKDAARVTYTCKGKGGAYSLIGVAYGAGTSRDTTVNLYREVGTGVMYFRTPADFHDRMERINAAMAAVGAAGKEGGE